MAMSPQLDAILTESGAPSNFRDWMIVNGVVTLKDFVLAARSDRRFVDQELIEGCGLTANLPMKIAIRRA